jgi:ATP-dependent Clp protease protease subunit
MAQLKIYTDIQSESDKTFARLVGDVEGVSFADIDAFCNSIPADDNQIEVRLHCDGGSVTEGWAMYDRLRATGKEITCIVEGNAASMATVILMAAPKERRKAYENAHILVHNPWAVVMTAADAADMQKMANDLKAEQERLVNLYVERCGIDRDTIQSLMDEDKFITAAEAKELGIIGEIIPPISAKVRTTTNPINMNEVNVKASLLDRMLAKLGFKTLDEAASLEIKALELSTADGQTLTIEREEGQPQVGDAANPDGEWLMPDGTTIVVENGVITDIKPKEDAPEGNADDDKKGEEPTTEEDDKDEEMERLRERIAELEKENEELRQQLESANANARTTDDLRILNAVKMAGGEEALKKFSSTYTPDTRMPQGKKVSAAANGSLITADDIRQRYQQNVKSKIKK